MDGPFWMERGAGFLGLHEDSDAAQEIAALWGEAKGIKPPNIRGDKYHWCSVFVGAALGAKHFDLSGVTAMAKSWLRFKSAEPVYLRSKGVGDVNAGQYGDIVVYDRTSDPAKGHVNFLIAQDANAIEGLGGNQSDRVTISRFAKAKVAGILRPRPGDGKVVKPAPVKHDGSDFARALEIVFGHEGEWSDHPDDPGGKTKFGITEAVLHDWDAAHGLPRSDIRALTKEKAEQIYREWYWAAAKCDSLESWAMRLMHFDTAVNQGVARAVMFLQMALKVDVDAQFGPITAAAEDEADQAELLTEYAARRMTHYGGLRTFPSFGLGWSRRLMRTALPAFATLDDAPAPEQPSAAPVALKDFGIMEIARHLRGRAEVAEVLLKINPE